MIDTFFRGWLPQTKVRNKSPTERKAIIMNLRYAHTNLIAKDWRSLSNFYQKVFGCKPIGHQRDLSGKWIEDITGIKNAHIVGEHLVLPEA